MDIILVSGIYVDFLFLDGYHCVQRDYSNPTFVLVFAVLNFKNANSR